MFGWMWAVVDVGLGVAERVDRWLDRRKERKREQAQPRGLTFKDVRHIQAQIESASRPLPPPRRER